MAKLFYIQTYFLTCFVTSALRNFECIYKTIGLQSKHKLYHIYKSSYMFRLYICSHHQAEYQILNKKTLKYNTILLYVYYSRSYI